MPRKIKSEQEGRFAKNRKHRNQWPIRQVWGSGPGAERALEGWFARRECQYGCDICAGYLRLSRIRRAYARRR